MIYVSNLQFLRDFYLSPLWDEIRRVRVNESKAFASNTAHELTQILPHKSTLDPLIAIHQNLIQHVESVLLGWPAIPFAQEAALAKILAYMRIYKSYQAQVRKSLF